MTRFTRALMALWFSTSLSACHCCGGDSVGLRRINGPTKPMPPALGITNLHVSVFIPARGRYNPLPVSSIVFNQSLSGGTNVSGKSQVLTIGPATCFPVTGGQNCVAILPAVAGRNQWEVRTYANTDGTGAALSTANLVKTIVPVKPNNANLTLNPIITGLQFVPVGAACNAQVACSQSLALNPLDATHATIIGPGAFVTTAGTLAPIALIVAPSLALRQSSNAAAVQTISQPSENNLVSLAYDGSTGPGTQVVTAQAPGIPPATFTLTLASGSLATAPIVTAMIAIGDDAPTTATVSINEPGYTGAFTTSDPGDTCTGIADIGAVTSLGPMATVSVSQTGGGTCDIVVSDNRGGSSVVIIKSTTYQINLQSY